MDEPLTSLEALRDYVKGLPEPMPGHVRVFRGQATDHPTMKPSALRGAHLPDTHIFNAFTRARNNYWARVTSGEAKGKEDLRYLKLAETVGDPLPYGLEENYRSLEALIRFAHQQKLIARAPSVKDAFADPRMN